MMDGTLADIKKISLVIAGRNVKPKKRYTEKYDDWTCGTVDAGLNIKIKKTTFYVMSMDAHVYITYVLWKR